MLAKVEFVQRLGSRLHSAYERYVFDLATVTEASPCYYLIEGEAKIYKGKISKQIKGKKHVRIKVIKTKYDLKIEKVSNAVNFINEIE